MNQQQTQKLYVGNLNFDANEDQVRELFGTYGAVEDVKIVMDRFSGRSRGFAFVLMDSADSAGKAKEALNGQPFQGKALIIDWARKEPERRERPAGEFRGPRREGGGGWGGERREGGGGWGGGERREHRGGDRGERGGGFFKR
jgi:RNA recognition motif-containing protein